MRDSPSRTAEAVCFMRAAEQSRPAPARVLDDPHSALFLGPAMKAGLLAYEASGAVSRFLVDQGLVLGDLSAYIVCRHRFIDDHLVRALAEKDLEQVVLLGAGYDTRAYRFREALGARKLFEVDFPSTSRRKAQVVKDAGQSLVAPPGHTVVEVDFETQAVDERLLASGFRKGARTFFVWEGVSMYLTRATVKGTLGMLRALSAPGSELAMDFWYLLDHPDLIGTGHRAAANLLHLFGEPITFGIHPEDLPGFLERERYQLLDLADAKELAKRYVKDGRSVYPANYVVHAKTT